MKLRQSFWPLGSLSLLCLVTSPMQAQIVQDASLPNPSIVTPNDNTSVITGGTQAGPNLFHSFREFSVPTGESASFQQIDQGIENVISRVTGSSVSNIDSLIEMLGANSTVSKANFFLLNPNGIIFGPNARLNIGGSFLASTASSLNFADGTSLSATNSHTTEPLLTVSIPIGLQFGRQAASIQVQRAVLEVQPGKTLGLVGGELMLMGGDLALVEEGELRAEEGRIELGSVTGVVTPGLAPVQVSITPITKGWAFGYEGVQNFQDIQLSQGAEVIATGGGDIQVQGRRVTLTGGSQMSASTLGSNSGGTIAVTASESVEINGISPDGFRSGLFTRVGPEATGAGGNLTIETRQLLVEDGASVLTSSFGSGKAGNLTVQATESVLVRGTDDLNFSSNLRARDGGNLTIETGRLLVQDGALVLTYTLDHRNAGNLTVQNATEVELIGRIVADGNFAPTGLFTQSGKEATGNGGNLSISTVKLSVRDGAQINSSTFGLGNAGNLTVRATDIELVGAAISADGQLVTNAQSGLPFVSGLFAGADIGSRGNGGALTVETDRLSLRDGAVVQTSTLGEGAAGDLTVRATDTVELIGTVKNSQYPTSLLAVSGGISGLGGVLEATGIGGNLRIETGELIVQDRAAVAVSSLNREPNAEGAGTLEIQAQAIRLNNQGKLTATSVSGQGGDITLEVQDFLLLRRNNEISTTAGIEGAGGDGGNITIDTPFIVAVPSEDSNITANAFTGSGGRIQITAQGVFGLEIREQLTPLSDITAFSQQNPDLNGVVEINTLDVDPSQELVTLPVELIDASGLIANSCIARSSQQGGSFIITGAGALPTRPGDASVSPYPTGTVRPVPNAASSNAPNSISGIGIRSWQLGDPIVEPQGTYRLADGQVVLSRECP